MTNTATTTDPVLVLAGIIRQVDGAHNLSADALASAILAHPGSRWGAAAPSINFRNLLSPQPGFELLPDDGDPERIPSDAQQLGGKWWAPRFGSDSLAATFGAILERMVDAAHPTATFSELPAEGSRELYLSGDLVDDLIKKGTLDAYANVSEAEKLAFGLLKLLQSANSAEAAPTFPHISGSLASVLEAARIELNPNGKNGSLILNYLQQLATLPTAWLELPKDPPGMENDGSEWEKGKRYGWEAARDELQRQREQAGAVPTAAPTFPHISDDLMRSLVCDILYMLTKATDKALGGDYFSPIPEIRARLMEVLQLAAQEAESPAP